MNEAATDNDLIAAVTLILPVSASSWIVKPTLRKPSKTLGFIRREIIYQSLQISLASLSIIKFIAAQKCNKWKRIEVGKEINKKYEDFNIWETVCMLRQARNITRLFCIFFSDFVSTLSFKIFIWRFSQDFAYYCWNVQSETFIYDLMASIRDLFYAPYGEWYKINPKQRRDIQLVS